MRYEDAIKKHEPLTLYESGLVEGLRMYSWMKDGVTYVGTTGTTLGMAVDRAITEARALWPSGPLSAWAVSPAPRIARAGRSSWWS